MKTKVLKVKDDGTLQNNCWTPEEYYKLFDSPADNYNLVKNAPLVTRIAGFFIKVSWLEHHIVGWRDKMQYFQGNYIPEWIIIK